MKVEKKYLIPAVILIISLFVCFFMFGTETKYSRADSFAMDTFVDFQIWGNSNLSDSSAEMVSALDKQFSMYGDADISSIVAINAVAGETVSVSYDVYKIIEEARLLTEKYGNSVDITSGLLTELWGISTETPKLPSKEEALNAISGIDCSKIKTNIKDDKYYIAVPTGTKLDLGSVGKGYACDRLKELYDREEASCAVVSMGSSSLLYGKKSDNSKFTVEIKNPDGGEALGIIETDETFISTSGGYERFFEVDGIKYSHIFDLKTGFPAVSDLTSVTVLCDSGIESDFLSTLIFIDDINGLKKHLNASDYKIVAATSDKKVYVSDGLDFSLNSESGFTLEELK